MSMSMIPVNKSLKKEKEYKKNASIMAYMNTLKEVKVVIGVFNVEGMR